MSSQQIKQNAVSKSHYKSKAKRKTKPRIPHDNAYKLLFSFPEMVRDLLTGFIQQPWLAELDLNTLERVNGSYVTDELRHLEDDIIWRVRFQNSWLYLYLLVEFQSNIQIYMSVRCMTYVGLLYQNLIKQGKLNEGGKLPMVLPIVLYNGKPRWHAPTNIFDLIETPPGQLVDYLPKLKYLLLDEGALDESAPLALQNLVAALFRLEKAKQPSVLLEVVSSLVEWLQTPEQESLRKAFASWIKRGLIPGHFPGVEMPELNDLTEVKVMLSETVVSWTQQWKQEGIAEGIAKGKLEGKLEGEAYLLERQLEARFGRLNDTTRKRLSAASNEQLETWAIRILSATDLGGVFDLH